MPNYWRQLLIPWLMTTVLKQTITVTAQQTQNQQPSFEELNKSFQNLLMQHHRQQTAAGFGANNADGFRNPLNFDLRALHTHPLVFPPHAGFPPPYQSGSSTGTVNAGGFGLPMPPAQISVGGQQLVTMQPQPQLPNLSVIPPQTLAFPQQQIGVPNGQPENQITQFGQPTTNFTSRLPLVELSTVGNGNFALAPLIQPQTQQQFQQQLLQQQKLFAGPSSILSTAQLPTNPQPPTNLKPTTNLQLPTNSQSANASEGPPTAAADGDETTPKTTPLKGKATKATTVEAVDYTSSTVSILPIEMSTSPPTSVTVATTTTDSIAATPAEIVEGIDRLKLAQHLDKADLANLLHAANFSAGDARIFLKLVEKVLEDEVSQRLLEMQKSKEANVDNGTQLIFTEGPDQNRTVDRRPDELEGIEDAVHRRIFSLVIPPIHKEELDRYRNEATDGLKLSALKSEVEPIRGVDISSDLAKSNHQLNTANTHLSYGGSALDEGGDVTAAMTSGAKAAAKKGKPGELNRNSYGVRIASTDKDQSFLSSDTREPQATTGPTLISAVVGTTADYRTKEQADFDRLLEQLAESYVPSASEAPRRETNDAALFRGGAGPSDESSSDSGLPNSSAAAGFLNGAGRRGHRYNTRHPPHTAFEHLFEDYRFRLSGQNGVNDVIKALRNAHIGFYERRVGRKFAAARRSA